MIRVCDPLLYYDLTVHVLTLAALESGVDEMANRRFGEPTSVDTGRETGATGSDKKPIPEDQGGVRDDRGR